MKTTLLFFISILFFVIHSKVSSGQTQKDTMFAYLTTNPVVIDGNDADPCWAEAKWHQISNVWIPYNQTMKEGDFSGKFKLAWDSLYLYLLAEIIDDSLSDDHADPLDNYYNDDCLEFFVDEDRSKGNHLYNNNAFAYHVSIFYDAIDNATGGGVNNKKANIEVVMDTIAEHTYRWELAIKNYNSSFNINNPEASRVYLHHNKLMGFSIAYCDNDETSSRENFIGSTYMEKSVANDNYITADYFGTLLLIDKNYKVNTSSEFVEDYKFQVYPNPANDFIYLQTKSEISEINNLKIIDVNGRIIKEIKNIKTEQKINISELPKCVYSISLNSANHIYKSMFLKQ